ncbi:MULTISPECIES: hypothetical protein [unclassified Synechocystis]|uniref:hypothetical protein n=1 Tax=unclassified Synechocystis TaxID=2640012 RepID=UPI001CBE642F|nr:MULTISPECIES: hypothetical protein [unclassified Synechocystis]
MPDFQTFVAIVTTLLFFLTGVALKYDTIYFRNYEISIPQWAGLIFSGLTFVFVVLDRLLRGVVRLEEIQQRSEDCARAVAREAKHAREREEDRARAQNERAEAREREARRIGQEAHRIRVKNQYRLAVIRYQLDPNPTHRQQLEDILALLDEYGEML